VIQELLAKLGELMKCTEELDKLAKVADGFAGAMRFIGNIERSSEARNLYKDICAKRNHYKALSMWYQSSDIRICKIEDLDIQAIKDSIEEYKKQLAALIEG
jgi:hypothetical protein